MIRDCGKYWDMIPAERKEGYNNAAALTAKEKSLQILEDVQALRSQICLEDTRSRNKALETTGTAIVSAAKFTEEDWAVMAGRKGEDRFQGQALKARNRGTA